MARLYSKLKRSNLHDFSRRHLYLVQKNKCMEIFNAHFRHSTHAHTKYCYVREKWTKRKREKVCRKEYFVSHQPWIIKYKLLNIGPSSCHTRLFQFCWVASALALRVHQFFFSFQNVIIPNSKTDRRLYVPVGMKALTNFTTQLYK